MILKRINLLCIIAILCTVNCICKAQKLSPLNRNLQLTGNFGELRTNHFHTGLDFRASIGTPVYAVDSGYVSRVFVGAGGYGNALYITHPSGETSVYAHLDSFAPHIAEEVTRRQYLLKYYAVDLLFGHDDIKVERGELIAYTGNRGSSGGPHLHFEIRETETENPIDPLIYLKDKIRDTRPPKIKSVLIKQYSGVENNFGEKIKIDVLSKNGEKTQAKVKAWGEIMLGVKAYDYMDGMSNIYGVHYVKLYKDNVLIYSSHIDTLSFNTGRQINTYIDREEWMKNNSLFMMSYISQGNTLNFYDDCVVNERGVVTIDEERIYKFRYQVSDYYGNSDEYTFEIEGDKSLELSISDLTKVSRNQEYELDTEQFKITIPSESIYNDYIPQYEKSSKIENGNYSVIHTIEPYYAGVDKTCNISIKIDCDTIDDKTKYYIASLNSVGKNRGKVSQEYISIYKNGWLSTSVKTLGQFVVKTDLNKPTIKYLGISNGEIQFKITEKESGIKYFSGYINGEFVLFTYDIKDKIARYKIDRTKIKSDVSHNIKFEVIDNCGNTSIYTGTIIYQ